MPPMAENKPAFDPTETMSPQELATRLGRHIQTVRKWIKCGYIVTKKNNARVFVLTWGEVEKGMRANNLKWGKAK